MAIAARPDSPRWATAYPQGAAASTLLAMGFGLGGASALASGGSVGAALQAAGWAMSIAWLFAWLWREAILRIPGTRKFGSSKHRFEAQYACKSLVGVGMDFLVIETWDNLSRASLAGHQAEFDDVLRAVGSVVAGVKLRDPAREDVRDWAAHLRALDHKLREDPKQLG